MRLAHLDDTGLAKLRAVEHTLGTYLVAFEPAETRAERSDDQERRRVAIEQELGLVLVVFHRNALACPETDKPRPPQPPLL